MLLAILLGVGAGALIPVQTAINSRLSRFLGAILPASLVSFAIGTLGLGVLVLVSGTSVPWRATAADQPWCVWIGGLCGLAFLTLNIVLMPRIGASATVVLPLVGQVVGGLVIDLTGAFGTTQRALNPERVLGVVLVVLGAVLVNLQARRAGAPARSSRALAVLWLLGVAGGSLGAVQTAVNGRLGSVMGSALAAALVSFAVGTLGLVLLNLVTRQRVRPTGRPPAWIWVGGLLGATFVLVNALNAPVLGTSLTVSVVLLGQIACGLVLDHRGWFGIAPRRASARRLAGAALVLLGVVLVRIAG
ncbi:MAG TPA: DMT family transporter [Cellulomonas sp.]